MDHSLFKDCKGDLKFNYSLAHLTWLKVGGVAEVFYKPLDINDLQIFLGLLPTNYPLHTIGAGSNLLIRDAGVKGAVIKLGKEFNYIKKQDNTLLIGAATLNSSLVRFCLENEIGGFEFLVGIPGSIGGGIEMNAGAYGKEFKDIITSVKAMRLNGDIVTLTTSEIGFKYRSHNLKEQLIFLEASFKLSNDILGVSKTIIKSKIDQINASRRESQPINQKTAGSIFKNPAGISVWRLIDEVGMRGFGLGGAQISSMHCNFFINKGNATAAEFENIAEMARKKVHDKMSIDLQWEIKRWGEKVS